MTEAESVVREFAAVYPSQAVRRAIAYCESGELAWEQAAVLFGGAFVVAREAVR